jgi:hypothetical protein
MRNLLIGAAAIGPLLSPSMFVGAAQAEPQGQFIIAVDRDGGQPTLQDAQFIFGGRNFCWYDSGWQGPGFYWCGYAERRGLGWGGGAGWHGWHGWRGGGGGGQPVRNGYRGAARSGGTHVTIARTSRVTVARTSRGGARGGHPSAVRTASRAGGRGHGGGHSGGGDRKPGK